MRPRGISLRNARDARSTVGKRERFVLFDGIHLLKPGRLFMLVHHTGRLHFDPHRLTCVADPQQRFAGRKAIFGRRRDFLKDDLQNFAITVARCRPTAITALISLSIRQRRVPDARLPVTRCPDLTPRRPAFARGSGRLRIPLSCTRASTRPNNPAGSSMGRPPISNVKTEPRDRSMGS
jgi:hypothetical protein